MTKKAEPTFRLKKKIWDAAAKLGKQKYNAIQRELDNSLEKLRQDGSFFEDTPDVRTIKKIVQEINDLSPDVVIHELPQHVWHLRSDFRSIRMRTLSPDQKRHFIEVRNFIKQLISDFNFPIPTFYDLVLEQKLHFLSLSLENRIPEYIREHCPERSIWNNYSSWCNKVIEYIKDCDNLVIEIREEGERIPGVRKISDQFEFPIIRRISDWQLGEDLTYLSFFVVDYSNERELIHDMVQDIVLNEEDKQREEQLFKGNLLIAYGPMELYKIAELESEIHGLDEARPYVESYFSMGERLYQRDISKHIITLFKEIHQLSETTSHSLREIINSRSYYDYNCQFCP